jgi:putative MFS transporter
MTTASYDAALVSAGVGAFQKRLFAVFGLVWAADAMQVLAIGFTAPSIAAGFGIPVQQALQTGTALFLGMLVGAFLFGRLADRFGRRPVLIATVLIDAAFGFASAFAPSFGWLVALRFLTGLGVGGTLPVDYAMMAEFLPADRRGRWLVALEGFWAVGTVVLALASLAAHGAEAAWRVVFMITAAPAPRTRRPCSRRSRERTDAPTFRQTCRGRRDRSGPRDPPARCSARTSGGARR